MNSLLNTEIQADKGAIFAFSLPGGRRAPLPPRQLRHCQEVTDENMWTSKQMISIYIFGFVETETSVCDADIG